MFISLWGLSLMVKVVMPDNAVIARSVVNALWRLSHHHRHHPPLEDQILHHHIQD
jgi:hypothetical protein